MHPLNRTVWFSVAAIFLALLTMLMTLPSIATAQARSSLEVDPNTELLLATYLDGVPLGPTILTYQSDQELLIAFSELVSLLEFPIRLDLNNGRASGWFIDESRPFELDLTSRRVQAGAKSLALPADSFALYEDELFVRESELEKWFPISFQADIRSLTLAITAKETLPVQERLERIGRSIPPARTLSNEPQLPLQDDPYRAVDHRMTDIRLDYTNSRLDDDAQVNRNLTYSILSTGDLAWMTSRLYLNGTDDDTLNSARLTLERSRFDGPLTTNHMEFGDINPVSGSGTGRGALVRGGTAPLDGGRQLGADSVDLRGDMLPGWEVELYRNGALIDFQVVGDDGQYEFEDVPLVFGENTFELVMYGPYGEERTKVISQYVSTDTVGAGKFRYELAAMEADTDVFDLQNQDGPGDKGTARFLGAFNAGLTSSLAVNFSVDSFEEDKERIQNYLTGFSYLFSNAQTSFNYGRRPNEADTYQVSLLTRLSTLGLSLTHTQYDNSGLTPEQTGNDPTQWQSHINLDYSEGPIPFNLSLNHQDKEQSATTNADLGSTFTASENLRVSTTLSYERDDLTQTDQGINETSLGTVSFYTQHLPLTVRAGLSAFFQPKSEFGELFLDTRLRVDRSMDFVFDTSYQPEQDYSYYSTGFNWKLGWATLSPRLSYDSDERFFGVVSIATSLATAPDRGIPPFNENGQAGLAGIYSKVFLDHNANGVFDDGDDPIPDARVYAPQTYRNARSDEDGNVYIERVPAYRQSDVVLDQSTLADPSLITTRTGNSVMTRPGHWSRMQFPLIRTSELEGYVFRGDGQGGTLPIRRALVELISDTGEVFARQNTAYDGYYLFNAVPPGDYELHLAGGLSAPPKSVHVISDGAILSDLNFTLSAVQEQLHRSAPARLKPAPFLGSDTASPGTLIVPGASAPAELEQPAPTIEPEPVPASVTPEVDESRNWTVQFGAFRQSANADRLWQKLLNGVPDKLGRLNAQHVEASGLVKLWLAEPLSEGEAKEICQATQAAGFDCLARPRTNP